MDNTIALRPGFIPPPAIHSQLSTPVTIAPPQISNAGILNAASLQAGPVAPGELITIFGTGLGPLQLVPLELTSDGQFVTTSLAGTRVLFDGAPAPMIYTSASQIAAVTPFSLTGRTSTQVQVEYNGSVSNSILLPVTPAAPAIFTANSSGVNQAVAWNEGNSLNGFSQPCKKGSLVTIFATGGGQTVPAAQDGRIISGEPLPIALPVTARIGGVDASVVSAAIVPGMVSGVIQVSVRIPDSLYSGGAVSATIAINGLTSQPGVTLFVSDGATPDIEMKLQELKSTATLTPLPEIPNDRTTIPENWLALISWNTQVGATAPASTTRPPMVKDALFNLFSGTYQLLAAQEVPSSASAEFLRTLLPGGITAWQDSFFDTTDTMDNGYWFRSGIILRDSFPLFTSTTRDTSGRFIADQTKAQHPPQVAQFEVGDFDFTLITVHLTFAGGNTAESTGELRNVLDYLDWYFTQPDHDPDVIVCGDFNTPSRLSGQTGSAGVTLDSVFDSDPRFQLGERRFVVTVHQPTSRSPASIGGQPARNYDHCVLSANTLKEFIQARRVDTNILTDNAADPELRLTSDHFPIVAFFLTRGPGIMLDHKTTIRPPQ